MGDEAPGTRRSQPLVEIEALRDKYAEMTRTENVNEADLNLLWLRLWQAERRRDEILTASE